MLFGMPTDAHIGRRCVERVVRRQRCTLGDRWNDWSSSTSTVITSAAQIRLVGLDRQRSLRVHTGKNGHLRWHDRRPLALGFTLTIVSIRLVPVAVDLVGWRYALLPLAVGPLAGTVAMLRLRRLPESLAMANGRR